MPLNGQRNVRSTCAETYLMTGKLQLGTNISKYGKVVVFLRQGHI